MIYVDFKDQNILKFHLERINNILQQQKVDKVLVLRDNLVIYRPEFLITSRNFWPIEIREDGRKHGGLPLEFL